MVPRNRTELPPPPYRPHDYTRKVDNPIEYSKRQQWRMTVIEEEDAFWKIALGELSSLDHRFDIDDGALHTEDGELVEQSGPATYFSIGSDRCEPAILRLSSLSNDAGVWSPVGADVWFCSAILTAMLLNPSRQLQQCYDKILNCNTSLFTAVELGSGAVGLPGIALAWMLSQWQQCRVILTDNDTQCLAQLDRNVESCLDQFKRQRVTIQDSLLTAMHMDWTDGIEALRLQWSGQNRLDLVIGSELVYTPTNGLACYDIVDSILTAFPDALIVIVQVTDRDGWRNVFLPNVRANANLQVEEETIPLAIHSAATKLLPRGIALDRFDFGVCYITGADEGTL